MEKENLKIAVSKLHESLAEMDNVDPELKRLLQTLDEDIRLTLIRDELASENELGLRDKALQLVVRFGAEHPVIEPVLREIADMLGKMGI